MVLRPPLVHPVPYRLLLFDADGTLRDTRVDGVAQPRPPNHAGEWQLLPNVQRVLALYDWTQRGIGVCSNQGGIGLGYMQAGTAYALLTAMLEAATGLTVEPQQLWLCPHRPDKGCLCRKPQPMLLLQAISAYLRWGNAEQIRAMLPEVLYVGDQDSDREAADNAGVDFCWAQDFFGGEPAP
jgi:D-glycero-D-manno-heptose 1,7-bisphosphate phosphatase